MMLSSTISTLIGGTPPSNKDGGCDPVACFLGFFGLTVFVDLGEAALDGGVVALGIVTVEIGGVGIDVIPGVAGTRSK